MSCNYIIYTVGIGVIIIPYIISDIIRSKGRFSGEAVGYWLALSLCYLIVNYYIERLSAVSYPVFYLPHYKIIIVGILWLFTPAVLPIAVGVYGVKRALFSTVQTY